jgi:hypothetical protein
MFRDEEREAVFSKMFASSMRGLRLRELLHEQRVEAWINHINGSGQHKYYAV